VVFVGNQPEGALLPLRLVEHVMRWGLNLHGAWMSYSAPFPGHEWSDALAAMQRNTAQLRQMITHRVSLADLPAVFEQIHAHSITYRKIMVSVS
jgi:L-iditol 2-dehydrogenase